jgi:hypothetical protein
MNGGSWHLGLLGNSANDTPIPLHRRNFLLPPASCTVNRSGSGVRLANSQLPPNSANPAAINIAKVSNNRHPACVDWLRRTAH